MTPKNGLLKFGIDRILSEEIGHKEAAEPTIVTQGTWLDKVEHVDNQWSIIKDNFDKDRADKYLLNYWPLYSGVNRNLEWFLKTSAYLRDKAVTPTRSNAANGEVTNSASTKRKRSWSRAVFSNLQRKGLEKRFAIQKYITKPDRRQLAATLGLTDAQVKVWFQNRRMKWRHAKEEEKARKHI